MRRGEDCSFAIRKTQTSSQHCDSQISVDTKDVVEKIATQSHLVLSFPTPPERYGTEIQRLPSPPFFRMRIKDGQSMQAEEFLRAQMAKRLLTLDVSAL